MNRDKSKIAGIETAEIEKCLYYEKWVGRNASFPPRRSVKTDLKSTIVH